MKSKSIWCCGCGWGVTARLTNGREIYPHRRDLAALPFWKCDACGNFVGCHHKTKNPTTPLGCIPSSEIREARKKIHAAIDPLWKSGRFSRREVYSRIAIALGIDVFHTAELRDLSPVQTILDVAKQLEAAQ